MFAQELRNEYEATLKQKSITKIVLSILCPLIPLVFLIISVVQSLRIGRLAKKMVEADMEAGKRAAQTHSPFFQRQEFARALQEGMEARAKEKKPDQDAYFGMTEGVLFPAQQSRLA